MFELWSCGLAGTVQRGKRAGHDDVTRVSRTNGPAPEFDGGCDPLASTLFMIEAGENDAMVERTCRVTGVNRLAKTASEVRLVLVAMFHLETMMEQGTSCGTRNGHVHRPASRRFPGPAGGTETFLGAFQLIRESVRSGQIAERGGAARVIRGEVLRQRGRSPPQDDRIFASAILVRQHGLVTQGFPRQLVTDGQRIITICGSR